MKIFKLLIIIVLLLPCSCTKKIRPIEERIQEQLYTISDKAELGTVEYTISKIIKASDDAFYTIGDRKILFSCKAFVKAGIDLKEFSPTDVIYDSIENTITINLPTPKILSFNMPPENIQLEFVKVGILRSNFTAEERNLLLQQGEAAIKSQLPKMNLLEEAKRNACVFFESLFSQLNVKKINVVFRN